MTCCYLRRALALNLQGRRDETLAACRTAARSLSDISNFVMKTLCRTGSWQD